MNVAVETRELIALDGDNKVIHGTFHRPRTTSAEVPHVLNEQKPVGVVFLNSLFLPRTGTGDSAVYWADSFAAQGYPCFRIDLPGIGDSDAPLNIGLLDFINAGGFESIIVTKIEEIVNRFDLSGVIIVGHCAGAVSALYGGASSRSCVGLILMDPYFFLPQYLKQFRLWKRMVRWASRSRIGAALSAFYDKIKNIRLSFRGIAPPSNANFRLLQRWKTIASKGAPILILKAPGRKAAGTKPRVGEFDYLKYATTIAGRQSQVEIQLIEGTDHSFANRQGRDSVRRAIEGWLTKYFPDSPGNVSAENAVYGVEHSVSYENHATC
jgi:pimeloyl-ACP methyl ester carboxylesterase